MPGLAETEDATDPVVSDDELELWFSRPIDGEASTVFHAVRSSPELPFGTPVLVPELSDGTLHQVDWVSPDRCRLYATLTYAAGGGPRRIVVFKRPPAKN